MHLPSWFILITCLTVGVIFWTQGGGYRAASPLVFILGVTGFYLCFEGTLRNPFKNFGFSPKIGLSKILIQRRLRSQKKHIWKNHIPELVAGLYMKHIRRYPEWKNTAPEYMPAVVTAAVRTPDGHEKIILNFNEYEFVFKDWSYKTPDNVPHTHGLLEIFTGDKSKVFGLLLTKSSETNSEKWEADAIEACVIGEWLNDFKKLAAEILEIIRERTKEARGGG